MLDSLIEQVHGGRTTPGRPCRRRSSSSSATSATKPASLTRAEGVDEVVHLAAEVGVGQSMYAVDRYVSVNDFGTAVLFQQLIDKPVRRVVVASSMSIYGEGLYRDADGELRRGCRARSRAPVRTRSVGAASMRRGGPLVPVPTPEWKRPTLASVYALTQIRPGAADADPRAGLRHGRRGAAALQRLRPRPGALEPLHRRARDLRLAPAQRQAADDLRGRPAAARLRPCRGRRPTPSCWRSSTRRRRARSSTSAAARTARSREVARAARAAPWAAPDLAPEIAGKARAGDIRHCFADIAQGPHGARLRAAARFRARASPSSPNGSRGRRPRTASHEARKELELRGLVA